MDTLTLIINVINSEPGFPDYNTKKDFFINWSHRQDPKSNPQVSFSTVKC